MASATAVALSLHLQWSPWCHCESSFDLSLVPDVPGLYAVGTEDNTGRNLTIVRLEAVDSLVHALNRLFAADCPLRRDFAKGRCFVRYAEVADETDRMGALNTLQNWLAGRMPADAKSTLIEDFLSTTGFAPHPYRGTSD